MPPKKATAQLVRIAIRRRGRRNLKMPSTAISERRRVRSETKVPSVKERTRAAGKVDERMNWKFEVPNSPGMPNSYLRRLVRRRRRSGAPNRTSWKAE
jgi:hypothetical protein